MTRIVVAEIPENADRDLSVERDVLGDDVDIFRFCYEGDERALRNACRFAEIILTDFVPFSRSTLAAMENCRLISVAATGYSTIDIAAAADAGVSVCAIDEYCTDEVADHVMLLILSLCRRLPEYHEQVQTEKRWQFDSLTGLKRISELTLGIIGFGRIGQAVAKRASAFGMSLIAHDLHANSADADRLAVTMCDLTAIFDRSDVISLNCALTADNTRLINAEAFAAMRKQPILINCARGGLIDEAALAHALDNGMISAAGLDVLDSESPNLVDSNLCGRDNVILTPHVAFYSDASMLENRQISANNIHQFLDGNDNGVRKFIHRASIET